MYENFHHQGHHFTRCVEILKKNLFLISSVSFQSCDFLSWGPNITALSAQGCLNNQPTGSLFGGRFGQIKDNRKSHRNKQLPVVFALQIKVSHSMYLA